MATRSNWFWVVGSLLALPAHGQSYSHEGSVLNGFGGRATGGTYLQIGAGAQPGGVGTGYEGGSVHYAGGMINRAGFLNRFALFPDRDTNENGVPDEWDPDNDGDGLWDVWEVSGEKFSPVTPTDPNLSDSGHTGVSDYHAMIAGTDPYDADATFRIVDLAGDGTDAALTWLARGHHERIYVVRVVDHAYNDAPATVVWSNTVDGGTAPWYVTEATITNAITAARFFAVEVIRP